MDIIDAEAEEDSEEQLQDNQQGHASGAPEDGDDPAAPLAGADGYEEDGFVVTEPQEGEAMDEGRDDDEDDEEETDEDELDDDDLELIQENTGRVIKRKQEKKLKRLRKKRKTDDTLAQVSEEHIRVDRQGAQDNLREQLFEDEDVAEQPAQRDKGPEEIDFDRDEDEMDGFIVNEGGDRPRAYHEEDDVPARGALNADDKELLLAVFGQRDIKFSFDVSDDEEEEFLNEDEDAPSNKDNQFAAASQVFEPAAIKEHFLEERDEQIRTTDIPERLQLWEGFKAAEGTSLLEEAAWICQHYLKNLEAYQKDFEPNRIHYEEKIHNVLTLMLEESLEVPFIAEHRKDYFADRDHKGIKAVDLWRIMDWHDCWVKFVQRRELLRKLCQEQDMSHVVNTEQINEIHTIPELDDWFTYVARHQPVGSVKRRPVTRRLHTACQEHEIDKVAARIGLTAVSFGDNLARGYQKDKPQTESLTPQQVAELFVVQEHFLFETPTKVLDSAVKLLAQDIGTHPLVRKYLRAELESMRAEDERLDMRFKTTATSDGLRVVHTHHRYFCVRQLEDKPANCLAHDEYLLLQKAKREKLIDVEVSFSPDAVQRLKEQMAISFLDHDTSNPDTEETQKMWNSLRTRVLDDAIDAWLLPGYMQDRRKQLESDAQASVIASCTEKIRDRALAGKYCADLKDLESDAPLPEAYTIMACCHSEDAMEPTSLVVLDENLEVKDHMILGHNRSNSNYHRSIQAFIEKNMPHVIAVGTSTMRAVDFQEDLLKIALVLEQQQRCPPGFKRIHVCFCNDDLASIFRQSPRAKTEFGRTHQYKPLTLQAIALGRDLADPLIEVCNLARDPDELLCLSLHDLQQSVNRVELLKSLDRALIDVVNMVGVDFNLLMRNTFRDGPLQYVAGLGPRKALALRQGVALSGGVLSQRNDLIQKNLMGGKVFDNCVGFLKIVGTHDQDVLDSTRIHPEMYDIARQLAKIALGKGEDEEDNDEDENELVETVMLEENSHVLDDLEQQQWASYFENQGKGPMLYNMQMIIKELQDPYSDARYPYQPLSWSQVFELLTGELIDLASRSPSKRTLYQGALVDVKVLRIIGGGLLCMTESGVKGLLRIEEFSDSYNRDEAEQNPGAPEYSLDSFVTPGQTITARVLELHCENAFPIFDERSDSYRRKTPLSLSCRQSVLNDPLMDPFSNYIPDRWFRPVDDAAQNREEKRSKAVGRHARQIDHPNFKNVTKVEALEEMRDMDAGAFVIRPSSQGRDHLGITWKFAKFEGENDPDIYIHIDVKEEGLSDNVTVGSAFKIGDEKFEDLDELIASYLEPRIEKVAEMMRFRKYCAGTESEVIQKLAKEKETTKVPYLVMASREKVGRFVLAYQTRKLVREFIMIRSDGYWYRKQRFTKPNDVMSYFKKNFSKPIPK